MVTKRPVSEQTRQQGQGVLGEGIDDKWLLSFQGSSGATAWLPVILETRVHNFRIKPGCGVQAQLYPPVVIIKRFAQDELSAVCIVAQVQPVRHRAPFSDRITDHRPCCPCIHAPDDDMGTQVIA